MKFPKPVVLRTFIVIIFLMCVTWLNDHPRFRVKLWNDHDNKVLPLFGYILLYMILRL